MFKQVYVAETSIMALASHVSIFGTPCDYHSSQMSVFFSSCSRYNILYHFASVLLTGIVSNKNVTIYLPNYHVNHLQNSSTNIVQISTYYKLDIYTGTK